jgi:hypothetical protein
MHSIASAHVSAGVALVGAGVIAVTPLSSPPAEHTVSSAALRLAAASSSIANIPVNLVQDALNIPYVLFAAPYQTQQATDNNGNIVGGQTVYGALNYWTWTTNLEGSWWTYTPNNILGWDPGDWNWTTSVIDTLIPIPSLSGPIANNVNVFMAAEDPMNPGCLGIPGPCNNPAGFVQSQFQVPMSALMSGYRFPATPGVPIQAPWSGNGTIGTLDPMAPLTSYLQHLMAPPQGVHLVSPVTAATDFVNFIGPLAQSFNPFVPNSYLLDPCKNGCGPFIPPTTTSIPSQTNPSQLVTLSTTSDPSTGTGSLDGSASTTTSTANGQQTTSPVAGGRTPLLSKLPWTAKMRSTTETPSTDEGLNGTTTPADNLKPLTTNRLTTIKPSTTNASETNTSGTDTSATDTSATDTSATDTSATDKSATDKSATDTSATDKSATDKSATDSSETNGTSTKGVNVSKPAPQTKGSGTAGGGLAGAVKSALSNAASGFKGTKSGGSATNGSGSATNGSASGSNGSGSGANSSASSANSSGSGANSSGSGSNSSGSGSNSSGSGSKGSKK